ncbi:MAG: hypothetical protein HQL48_06965 [Gammaproteobacteria bacterium]|nr:hypothetical protein [Gammaproteobacteria bacterium]
MTDDEQLSQQQLLQLYRQGRKEYPSPEVDSAILELARKRLQQRTPASPRRTPRWTPSIAAAAVLVIGISFTLKLQQQSGEPESLGEEVKSFSSSSPQEDGVSAPAKAKKAERGAAVPEPQQQLLAPESDHLPAPAASMAQPRMQSAPMAEMELRDQGEGFTLPAVREQKQRPIPRLKAESWLAEIEALYSAGAVVEAQQQLARFLLQYPDYPLPEAIQPLRMEGGAVDGRP